MKDDAAETAETFFCVRLTRPGNHQCFVSIGNKRRFKLSIFQRDSAGYVRSVEENPFGRSIMVALEQFEL